MLWCKDAIDLVLWGVCLFTMPLIVYVEIWSSRIKADVFMNDPFAYSLEPWFMKIYLKDHLYHHLNDCVLTGCCTKGLPEHIFKDCACNVLRKSCPHDNVRPFPWHLLVNDPLYDDKWSAKVIFIKISVMILYMVSGKCWLWRCPWWACWKLCH